jgi:hypothetical protein
VENDTVSPGAVGLAFRLAERELSLANFFDSR